jgi:hypothetical protein
VSDEEQGKLTEEEKNRREDERRWRDLGVKIVMGFEIMYREDNKRSKSGEVSMRANDTWCGYADQAIGHCGRT